MKKIIDRTRGMKLPIIAVVGLIFALVTVLGRAEEPKKGPLNSPPKSAYVQSISGIGVVEPRSEIIDIGTELPGIVRAVHVSLGDRVKAGYPLFTLDEREVDAQIKILEATLASAKVKAEDSAAQFAIVKSVDDERAVARDDFNRRKFAASLADAHIDEVEAQLAQARITKERLTVRAPVDADILSLDVHPGEFASTGAVAVPLVRMGDTSTLHVRVEIDEENAGRVRPEAMAKGFRHGNTDISIPLTFVRFEPYVRPKQNLAVAGQRVDTRVLQIVYSMPEGKGMAFVGEQMDVFINDTGSQ